MHYNRKYIKDYFRVTRIYVRDFMVKGRILTFLVYKSSGFTLTNLGILIHKRFKLGNRQRLLLFFWFSFFLVNWLIAVALSSPAFRGDLRVKFLPINWIKNIYTGLYEQDFIPFYLSLHSSFPRHSQTKCSGPGNQNRLLQLVIIPLIIHQVLNWKKKLGKTGK